RRGRTSRDERIRRRDPARADDNRRDDLCGHAARRPRDDRRSVTQVQETTGRELFVRHAKKDGRSVTILRAVDYGSSCVVEAEVYPAGTQDSVKPGPYTFADAAQAT